MLSVILCNSTSLFVFPSYYLQTCNSLVPTELLLYRNHLIAYNRTTKTLICLLGWIVTLSRGFIQFLRSYSSFLWAWVLRCQISIRSFGHWHIQCTDPDLVRIGEEGNFRLTILSLSLMFDQDAQWLVCPGLVLKVSRLVKMLVTSATMPSSTMSGYCSDDTIIRYFEEMVQLCVFC